MKKILSIILALTLLLSMSVTAFAKEEGTQTVSVGVPTPCYDYTVHIPASCTIEYNNTEPQSIGSVTVTSDYWNNITTEYLGVRVYVKHNNYLSNVNGDSKIPCGIGYCDVNSHFILEDGNNYGWFIEYIGNGAGIDGKGNLYMKVWNWSNAQPGESYSVTITYTSELVVRH